MRQHIPCTMRPAQQDYGRKFATRSLVREFVMPLHLYMYIYIYKRTCTRIWPRVSDALSGERVRDARDSDVSSSFLCPPLLPPPLLPPPPPSPRPSPPPPPDASSLYWACTSKCRNISVCTNTHTHTHTAYLCRAYTHTKTHIICPCLGLAPRNVESRAHRQRYFPQLVLA